MFSISLARRLEPVRRTPLLSLRSWLKPYVTCTSRASCTWTSGYAKTGAGKCLDLSPSQRSDRRKICEFAALKTSVVYTKNMDSQIVSGNKGSWFMREETKFPSHTTIENAGNHKVAL